MVIQAMDEVRNQLWTFAVFDKENEEKSDDLVTSADYAAQQIYMTLIQKNNPNAWIVAEEDGVRTSPQWWSSIVYTIDPVDWTKALVRKQSDGIWTLFWVVDSNQNEIIAAYVGDIMTNEVYYYEEWWIVWRSAWWWTWNNQRLQYSLKNQKRILTLDDIRNFPERSNRITKPRWYRNSLWVSNWSIGTNMAKLWKCEVDAVLLKSWLEQPRDWVPCAWISHPLWYTTIAIESDGSHRVVPMNQSWSLDALRVPYQLIVHKHELVDVLSLLESVALEKK